ncbi:uncharacterized protein LOC112575494 [Pomacea canaliculata]|uniref:uncharacterized protein LOC112575494 n=1 Tax=Pomacea canaliculata TaxID=400727 RepID=UPI000D734684|nr:uncharacterized protein LOC112575494 [Pomacea canaliculata]
MQTNMADDEDVLFEGLLYRLKVSKNKTLHRLPPERWKSKYIILCRGEKLVLKCFRKKPKIRKLSSRHKEVALYPSFKVDKLSNINGRAFAVQITSPEHQLCFSADEQSTIDICFPSSESSDAAGDHQRWSIQC